MITTPISPTGAALAAGPPGESAYQLWLDLGNNGNLQQYLQTLVGPMGPPGPAGLAGPVGAVGYTGNTGNTGATGPLPWQTPPVPWTANTAFTAAAPASAVTYLGGCYVCTTSHTSGSSFDNTKWTQIAAPGAIVGAPPQFQCRLVFTSTSVVTLLPWAGSQIFINGSYYTVPAGGVTIAPSGSVGAVMAVYATPNGSSVSLLLSATQPSTGQYGTAILGTDETKVHVGDVQIQSGPAFALYYVVSKYNKQDVELSSASITATTANTSPSIINGGWTIGLMVAANEPVSIELIGNAYNYAGSTGYAAIAAAFINVNGGTQTSQNTFGASNTGTYNAIYARVRPIATSTQSVSASANMWSSSSSTTSAWLATTILRTRQ